MGGWLWEGGVGGLNLILVLGCLWVGWQVGGMWWVVGGGWVGGGGGWWWLVRSDALHYLVESYLIIKNQI